MENRPPSSLVGATTDSKTVAVFLGDISNTPNLEESLMAGSPVAPGAKAEVVVASGTGGGVDLRSPEPIGYAVGGAGRQAGGGGTAQAVRGEGVAEGSAQVANQLLKSRG